MSAGSPAAPGDVEAELRRAGLPSLPRSAWLRVDLDRLAGNLAALRELLPPRTPIQAVVKADAYGHGAVPLARSLERAGADAFGVATLDEGLELRAAGVTRPVLVLYPVPPDGVELARRASIAVTLGDALLAARTLAALAPGQPPLEVHVEVETGLGRGGVDPAALAHLVARVRATPAARLVGVWSHLGSPGNPERTDRQADALAAARRALEAVELDEAGAAWHLAASGGVLGGAVAALDGVRLGLALYGVVPDELRVASSADAVAGRLRAVMSLHARPVRVADLPTGSAIGYGERFVTDRPSRVATLPVGYADGYHRVRSGTAHALVRGVRAPIVGVIAMDALMVDVTDVPGERVGVDDEFVLLGEQGGERIAAADLARLGTTISWEVLAAMARRMTRVYYAGAVPVGLRTLTDERGWWTEPDRRESIE